MAFHFRFARVKSVRELEEDLSQQRLAIARQSEQRQRELLAEAKRSENDALGALDREQLLTTMDWEFRVRNCHELAQTTLDQGQRCLEASNQVEATRDDLLQCMRKAKILQSLYDRQSEAWHRQEIQAEQKVLDEVGGMQYLRNSRIGR